MKPHRDLIEKWRARYEKDGHPGDMVFDGAGVKADGYFLTSVVTVDSPAGSGSCIVFFDSPADFVAWLRWCNLPHSLAQATSWMWAWPDYIESADDYPGLLGDPTDALIRECLDVMDQVLDQPEVGAADAGRAIDAYESLFESEDFGVFLETLTVHDGLLDCLRAYEWWFEILDEEELGDPVLDPFDLERHRVGTLLESGALDPDLPEHLDLVRSLMPVLEEYLIC